MNALAGLIETHIANKSGLSGMAMKMGLASLRKTRPDIATRATLSLWPEIAAALAPLHAEFSKGRGRDFGDFLTQHAERATRQLIDGVDARVALSRNGAMKALYQQFRGSAASELQKLMPAIGKTFQAYL